MTSPLQAAGRSVSLAVLIPAVLFSMALSSAPLDPISHPEVDLRDGLSEREAVVVALARNPELIALRKGRDVAAAGILEAKLLPNPEIRLAWADFITDLEGVGIRRNNVGLRWSPPKPGDAGLKADTARSRVQETNGAIATAEQRLAADVRILYRTVALLHHHIRFAEENQRVREAILETVKAQAAAGVKSALDQSVSEMSLADARVALEQYRSELSMQSYRLKSRLDLPRGFVLTLEKEDGLLSHEWTPAEREELIARALARRGELTTAAGKCSQAQLNLLAQSRDRIPWLATIQMNRRFGRSEPGRWGVQFGVDLPVFRWRGEGMHVATAELDHCRQQQHAVRSGIIAEIEDVLVRMDASATALQQHRQIVDPVIAKNMELSSAALAAGQADALEPLLSQARQISTAQVWLARLMDLRTLEVGLDHALGQSDMAPRQ